MAQTPAVEGLEKDKTIYMELMGASNLVGINYDARFNDHTRFGWRAGVSFGYGHDSGLFGDHSDVRGYAVPLEVNYLLGSQKNNLEIGVGASVGIYNIHERVTAILPGPIASLPQDQQAHAIGEGEAPDGPFTVLAYEQRRNALGYFFFGNIGYRHVSRKGFLFRVGVSPSFHFSDSHAIVKSLLYPYLGFGWAF
ncbi:MAG: hypothetical protein K6A82_08675 [Prevotella sp.]|nr:hypothetical protein [Prevotella sp.]